MSMTLAAAGDHGTDLSAVLAPRKAVTLVGGGYLFLYITYCTLKKPTKSLGSNFLRSQASAKSPKTSSEESLTCGKRPEGPVVEPLPFPLRYFSK